MVGEVPDLVRNRFFNRHLINDILLRATFHAVVAKFQRIGSSIEQLKRICAFIHKVNLCQHAYCAFTARVDLLCELQRI